MRDAETLAVKTGEWYFACIVVAAVVERYSEGYIVFAVVQQGDAVHPPTDDNNTVFCHCLFCCDHFYFHESSLWKVANGKCRAAGIRCVEEAGIYLVHCRKVGYVGE